MMCEEPSLITCDSQVVSDKPSLLAFRRQTDNISPAQVVGLSLVHHGGVVSGIPRQSQQILPSVDWARPRVRVGIWHQ